MESFVSENGLESLERDLALCLFESDCAVHLVPMGCAFGMRAAIEDD